MIFNSKIIVKTDNRDLIHVGNLTKRIERLKVILEEFDIDIQYLKETSNKTADAFSRLYSFSTDDYSKYAPLSDIQKWQYNNKSTMIYSDANKIKKTQEGYFVDSNERIFIPSEVSTAFLEDLHLKLVHHGKQNYITPLNDFITFQKLNKLYVTSRRNV
ncbi:hypothetical protein DMUE_3393 [Dictyocoela muelleri]|nr:hypothetical protein DMUE_3393 [Dictyocoela muelleri]